MTEPTGQWIIMTHFASGDEAFWSDRVLDGPGLSPMRMAAIRYDGKQQAQHAAFALVKMGLLKSYELVPLTRPVHRRGTEGSSGRA